MSIRGMKNKIVKDVLISKDKTLIVFVCTTGNYAFQTEGDCCSHSWIEHLSGIRTLKSKKPIERVTDIAMPPAESCNDYDVIKTYGVQFDIAGKGHFTIEYRNSSNGYYGGSIEFCNGGISDKTMSELTSVKKDF